MPEFFEESTRLEQGKSVDVCADCGEPSRYLCSDCLCCAECCGCDVDWEARHEVDDEMPLY
jgi:hypothetical protein